MKKIIYIILLSIIFSCRSVDNWGHEPILLDLTISHAKEYVVDQTRYIELIKSRNTLDIKNNLSIEQLDELLVIEKEITLASRKVANSWFDFFLQLRQDPGYTLAYRGHYYFRKGVEALGYSDRMKRIKNKNILKDNKSLREISLLEGKCRLAIGEIVAHNLIFLETDVYYKKIKQLYRSLD